MHKIIPNKEQKRRKIRMKYLSKKIKMKMDYQIFKNLQNISKKMMI